MNLTRVLGRVVTDCALCLSRPLLPVLILSAIVLSGCGGGERVRSSDGRNPETSTGAGTVPRGFAQFEDRRAAISVAYPSAWHVIRQSLTQVGQLLVVTSFPLHQSASDKNCSPRTAIEQMPSNGAFLYMFEYARARPRLLARFPPRPSRFRLRRKTWQPYECMGLSYMVRFRDRGRAFQAHVFLGKRATKRIRARVLEILDRLGVGPAPVKPGRPLGP
jgi:hypothetical protein